MSTRCVGKQTVVVNVMFTYFLSTKLHKQSQSEFVVPFVGVDLNSHNVQLTNYHSDLGVPALWSVIGRDALSENGFFGFHISPPETSLRMRGGRVKPLEDMRRKQVGSISSDATGRNIGAKPI
ncbi:predicted protein [Histoplasma capsulatum G186AR]|uniref:Uncharacterized protein n=1 Tax=Ajellomyces capsulatus (strain G186AR / H82 / ATCC MYA-2454 / RMSCC 2432) TaxID=447093 RepID=C0NFV2_AJECG|nr:uncharacterized protein HCBG_01768 [Histoplasma capsulatum G186AR]EEH10122.1 predicted protein [Histoplasma capsulatum G186AR]